jgi:hypothetical protein
MGFEAGRIAALRNRDQDKHFALVDRERGVTRIADLQPAAPGMTQRLQEGVKGCQHFAAILPAQERELARDQGTATVAHDDLPPTPDQQMLPITQPCHVGFAIGTIPHHCPLLRLGREYN